MMTRGDLFFLHLLTDIKVSESFDGCVKGKIKIFHENPGKLLSKYPNSKLHNERLPHTLNSWLGMNKHGRKIQL
jgi:hypothetical protein